MLLNNSEHINNTLSADNQLSADNKFERVNYHTHCERCRHAFGTVREYAQEAQKKNLVRLGFSDHLPYPDDRFGMRMLYSELDEYMQEVSDVRRDMRNVLDIFCGFEGEYVRKDAAYYEWLLGHKECEYLILGQHFYENKSGEIYNVYNLQDTNQYEEYSVNVVEAMKTGYFRYVAHPDIIFLNILPWDIHCDRACDILIEGSVKYHIPLEYNANGFRRNKKMYPEGERYPYPVDRFWDKAAGASVDVYVGSDCHEPHQVYDETVIMAYDKLMQKGIKPRTDW